MKFQNPLFFLMFCLIIFPLSALDVDDEELKSYGNKSIEFTSYTGPRTGKVDTIEAVINIGRYIGRMVDIETSDHIKNGAKYSVIHSYQPEIEEGYDADIVILHPDSRVDHIRNLRFIVAGYLEKAYDYSFNDAVILAEFITYYNAVYYKDLAFFQGKYKPGVLENISADKCGISTHYSDWPGKTQLVIPLRGAPEKGSLSNIDTSEITDDKVIEEIKKEEDKGIDSRKDMTELRERELDEEQDKLDEQKDELKEKEETVDKELTKLEEKEEKGETLTTEEETRKNELEKEKEVIEEEKEVIEEKQDDIDERTEEVIAMRDETAKDENKEFNNDSTGEEKVDFENLPEADPAFFLRIDTAGKTVPFGTIIKYDLNSLTVMKVSSVNSIRGRTVLDRDNGIVAIAGKEGSDSAVKLVLLDKDTLEIIKESEFSIYPGSILISDSKQIYCVTAGDESKIAAFDSELNNLSVSDVSVLADTAILTNGQSIIVQSPSNNIIKLRSGDLTEVE